MATVFSTDTPYLFNVSFDVPDPETSALDEDEAVEPQLPTYSLEDVKAAREEGRRKGHEAGLSEAGRGIENALNATMETLAAHFKTLTSEQTKANAEIEREGIGAAIAIVRKLFPSLAQEHGFAEVESVMRQCLVQLLHEPRVKVVVSSEILDAARERLQAMLESVAFTGQLDVIGDDNLGTGDCRIEWANGEARRESERVLGEIDEAIDQTLHHATEVAAAAESVIEDEPSDASTEDQEAPLSEENSAPSAAAADDALTDDAPPEEIPIDGAVGDDSAVEPTTDDVTTDDTAVDDATEDAAAETAVEPTTDDVTTDDTVVDDATGDAAAEAAVEPGADFEPQLQHPEIQAVDTEIEEQAKSPDAVERADTGNEPVDEEQVGEQSADGERPNS